MASRACLLLLMGGCIMPPAIDEGVTLSNQAPRILPESLTPDPANLPKTISVVCEPGYMFLARVRDPDPLDTIYWRTFVDYSQMSLAEKLGSRIDEELPSTPPNPEVSRLVTFPVFGSDFGGDFSVPHVLDLLVSDRPFTNDEQDRVGRKVEEDGLTDIYTWAIKLIPTSDENCLAGGGG